MPSGGKRQNSGKKKRFKTEATIMRVTYPKSQNKDLSAHINEKLEQYKNQGL